MSLFRIEFSLVHDFRVHDFSGCLVSYRANAIGSPGRLHPAPAGRPEQAQSVPDEQLHSYSASYGGLAQRVVLSTWPLERTYQRSLASGLPARRSASQSATRMAGNGPRLAEGTLPTECRDSW